MARYFHGISLSTQIGTEISRPNPVPVWWCFWDLCLRQFSQIRWNTVLLIMMEWNWGYQSRFDVIKSNQLFLKFYMKLVGLMSQKLTGLNFWEKFLFREKAWKFLQNRISVERLKWSWKVFFEKRSKATTFWLGVACVSHAIRSKDSLISTKNGKSQLI